MFEIYKLEFSKIWLNLDNSLLRLRSTKYLEKTKTKLSPHLTNGFQQKNKENAIKKLPEKKFKYRRSLLVELFEDNVHFKAVYNIFISFFSIFVLTICLKEYVHHRRLPPAFNVIFHCFGQFHLVALVWIANNILTILVYYGFSCYNIIRPKVKHKKIWDKFCLMILLGYYVFSFSAISYLIEKRKIPFASAMILAMESVRFLIKIYAFIRSNWSIVLESESGKGIKIIPNVSTFIYFLYVPTAVYRTFYPRTAVIRWSFVGYRFLEVVSVIIFYAFCFENVARPLFQNICLEKLTQLDVLILILEFSVPSILMLWALFFVLLHSSQNLVSELLRFGDRLFYTDWWNSKDIQCYYRSWNLVIGDWLYTYVHKDICEIVCPGKKNLSKLVTILVSAVVHEWIATITTGYFLPLVTLSMMLSAVMVIYFRVTTSNYLVNLYMIFVIILGSSCIGTFYALEHFSRAKLNVENTFFSSVLIRHVLNK